MPQMSPMNWFSLFIFFNMNFYICSAKLFQLSKLMKHYNTTLSSSVIMFSHSI